MKKSIMVFGGGQQGQLIANDLLEKGYNVSIVDIVDRNYKVPFIHIDVTDQQFENMTFKNIDLVVCALPAELGERCVRQVVKSGVDVIDVSFTKKDYRETDIQQLAIENKCKVVADCGLAPGLPNLIIGDMLRRYGTLSKAGFCVGSVAANSNKNYLGYVPSWSIPDLCSEYTRNVRIVVNGKVITLPPPIYHTTHDLELIETPIGEMEAFYSDGVRSLLRLRNRIPTIIEKTLRWPGHITKVQEIMKVNEDFYDVKALEEAYTKLDYNNDDVVLLSVDVVKYGNKESFSHKFTMEMFGDMDGTAMSQTTGHSCSGFASLLLNGHVSNNGVFYPEDIGLGSEDALDVMLDWLDNYGITFEENVEKI